jgi:hypothetical protein
MIGREGVSLLFVRGGMWIGRVDSRRRRGGSGSLRRRISRVRFICSFCSLVLKLTLSLPAARATFTLPPNEEGQSVCALRLPAHPEASSLFIVGSTKLDLSAPEPTEGRLLVLRSTTGSDTLEELTSRNVGGCPYGVVPLAGEGLGEYVAAAVNSQVAVFRLVTRDDASVELEVVATWSGAFVALSLAAGADGTLVVGDALRSITVLRFSLPSPSSAAASTKPKLEELGKDYRSRYMVGVESLPSPSSSSDGPAVERFIGAETDLNLFTVEREPAAGVRNLADAGTLTAGGAFHLGEMVTKFRRGVFLLSYTLSLFPAHAVLARQALSANSSVPPPPPPPAEKPSRSLLNSSLPLRRAPSVSLSSWTMRVRRC